jgi:hypothetical protein
MIAHFMDGKWPITEENLSLRTQATFDCGAVATIW